jgi:hypothetical protein
MNDEEQDLPTKKCICCDKIIEESFGQTKYCTSCSLYVMDRIRRISQLERRLEQKNLTLERMKKKIIKLMGKKI